MDTTSAQSVGDDNDGGNVDEQLLVVEMMETSASALVVNDGDNDDGDDGHSDNSSQLVYGNNTLLGSKQQRKHRLMMYVSIATAIVLSIIAIAISSHALSVASRSSPSSPASSPPPQTTVMARHVRRIAFGSCVSYDYRPQYVWRTGVIPSDPDAWIWAGDSVYMDLPPLDCDTHASSEFCNCTRTWIRKNNCGEGNLENAMQRVQAQLQHDDYIEFMRFLCPHAEQLPPKDGMDPSECERSFTGTYDDHDYGWNNGDRRLPHKTEYKQLFLDTIGVPFDSPRRNRGRGIYWRYAYNAGTPAETDVYLLDERYERNTLPCHIRRRYCEEIVLIGPTDARQYPWCYDFIYGNGGNGSCCDWDDRVTLEWCVNNAPTHPLHQEACNASAPSYGYRSLEFVNDTLQPVSERSDEGASTMVHDAPFCEVLGKPQRQWLQSELETHQTARLKVIVSGSVITHNPSPHPCYENTSIDCTCGTDDFDCYPQARINLLSTLQRSMMDTARKGHEFPGCVVVLTGDFHFSDIKIIEPGTSTLYHQYYDSGDWAYPIYQVMASGLTRSTARPYGCNGWAGDHLGLRYNGTCNYISGEPSFGFVEVEWDLRDPIVHLQLRDQHNNVRIEKTFRLSTCR